MDEGAHPYIGVARKAIHHYLDTGQILELDAERNDPPPSGVFVAVYDPPRRSNREGRLRGRIGSVTSTRQNLRSEIAHAAVLAAISDPSLKALRDTRVDRLHIVIYLLGEPDEVQDPSEIDPARHGVLLQKPGGRSSLVLPGTADTADEMIALARQQGGIGPRTPVDVYRFPTTILQ